ncbi:phosphoribosylglycinamide formyltransferase [Membranihabitans maritimus]|uniref:phosphoribosylglycinamide formyltransferase n=1 Tax=Membranihabitans maritimus TaxID=2904244 RepID=UPI001F2F7B49|nr:phosphoribosylglycinamide formyltransferase [Membranihabitans maritimus]
MQNIAILASGSGSNAEKIMEYFSKNSQHGRIAAVLTNNSTAGVQIRARKYGVPFVHISRKDWKKKNIVLPVFDDYKIDFIVLAGFLQMIPAYLIKHFGDNIVNIHPALLPLYGGKGMYGMNVHRAVYSNNEPDSGITIHRVNEIYDDGEIIFQARCTIDEDDSPEEIQRKVQVLEHKYFPMVINYLVANKGA